MLRPFAILSLFNTIIILLFGEFIFLQDTKNPLNRLYAIFSIVVAGWAFSEYMMRSAQIFETALIWNKILAFFWPFSSPVFLHLVLTLTEKTKVLQKWWLYVVLYLPASVTTILDFSTEIISTGPILPYWGWTYTLPKNKIPFFLAAGWLFIFAIVALIITFRFYLSTDNPIKKKQAQLLTVGFAFPVFAAFTTELLLPLLNIRIPELMTTFMMIMIVVIGYALVKYELFLINPVTAADNIVSTMTDSLIITNNNSQIISINKATINTLGYKEKELRGKNIYILFKNKKMSKQLLASIIKKKKPAKNCELDLLTKQNKAIPVLFSCSPIFTKREKLAGTVCVAKDISDRKKVEEANKKAEIRQVYVDVFHAVTDKKLIIMLKKDLEKELGKPISSIKVISAYKDLTNARAFLDKATKKYFFLAKNFNNMILAADEAMTNTLKHAKKGWYQIFKKDKTIQLLVSDNGPGIDFKSLPRATLLSGYSTKQTLGVGFNIMLESSNRILLASDPSGTKIVLEIKPTPNLKMHKNSLKI